MQYYMLLRNHERINEMLLRDYVFYLSVIFVVILTLT